VLKPDWLSTAVSHVLDDPATNQAVCEIRDSDGEPVVPEGLMYQLIIRFSLGRHDYRKSVHWQSGMILDDAYNDRALITIDRARVRVQVRAAYPRSCSTASPKTSLTTSRHSGKGYRCTSWRPAGRRAGAAGPEPGCSTSPC
jgi:hypothetical protein